MSRPTNDLNENAESTIVFRLPTREKARWVRAASRGPSRSNLSEFIRTAVAAKADSVLGKPDRPSVRLEGGEPPTASA